VYTFTDAAGNVIDTIDTNAAALAYDGTVTGLGDDVQEAIDTLDTNITTVEGDVSSLETAVSEINSDISDINTEADELAADVAQIDLVDNGDGNVTLVKADGSSVTVAKSNITDNNDGTYTFTNNDGTDVVINANSLDITETGGVYTFTDAAGNVIDTIDTNAAALAYDGTVTGLGDDVQEAIDTLKGGYDSLGDNLTAADGINASIEVVDGGIGATLIATSLRVKDGGISTTKLASDAVTSAKIANGAILNEDLAEGAVNSAKIADGTIATGDIANDAITAAKINADVAGAGLTQNTTTGALEVNLSGIADGDITSSHLTVTNGTNAAFEDVNLEIAEGAVGATEIAAGAVGTSEVADNTLTADDLAPNSVTNSEMADDAVTTDEILDGTIAPEDMASGGADQVLTTSSGGLVEWSDKSTLAIEPWFTQDSEDKASSNTANVYLNGNVGIGDFSDEESTYRLDVLDGNVRIREINDNIGSKDDRIVVADSDGELKTVKAAMPRMFYMPPVIFDTSVNGTGLTRNLYQEYVDQFTEAGNPTFVKSADDGSGTPTPSAIPVHDAADLYFYITYYDETVFDNISIDANGVMTYDIIGPGTETSYMNIVFVVKN